jgi:hypothetical protein
MDAFFGVVFVAAVVLAVAVALYNRTTYKKDTGNSFWRMMTDAGIRGEYETFRRLKQYEAKGFRFLFNVYLPKDNGKTTEIDVLMICSDCVFVFESKNYSGWIFGSDSQKLWTQVLPVGKGKGRSQKNRFYNPVWQNRTHCAVLKRYLPEGAAIHSVVLFSERCTLKDVTVGSSDVAVIRRPDVGAVVSSLLEGPHPVRLDVGAVYDKLYPFSQSTESVRQTHIDDVNSYRQP